MPALILLGILAIISVVIGGYVVNKKRREAIVALAARMGLQYSAGDPFAIDQTMPHRLFGLGEGRGCENVMWGTYDGMPVTAFEYWYYTTSTDSEGHTTRSTYRFTCVLTYLPLACTHLTVTAENMLTRLGSHLGFRDIEMETEEFNNAWRVSCEDRKFATDVLDQRMMQWLMTQGRGWSFEAIGRIGLVYAKRRPVAEIPTMIGCAKAFRDHIPAVATTMYPLQQSQSVPGHDASI